MKKNTYYVINNRIFKYCKNAIKYGEKCGYGVLFVFTSKKEAFKRLKENNPAQEKEK